MLLQQEYDEGGTNSVLKSMVWYYDRWFQDVENFEVLT